MTTPQEKAQCVWWYVESKSPVTVQRQFRRQYGRDPPSKSCIMRWVKNFQETGSVKDLPRSGRPGVSQQTVENVQVAFQRSPQKSIRRASRELHVPKSTIHKVLHKRLQLHPYKVQIIQHLQPNDRPIRYEFATTMLNKIEGDNEYLQKVMFSDECTFFVSGHVNRHNVRIWGTENPRSTREHIRGSPKVNVWCALMHNKVIGPFFFAENTITGISYCDMIQEYLLPQVEEMQPAILFQQDGAPPHWSNDVRQLLDTHFPGRWIGRGGPITWPPRSPDITPLDFFLWGYVKDRVYQTPVQDLVTLRERIVEAIQAVDVDMLQRVWMEMEYRLDILRATKGAHVEVL